MTNPSHTKLLRMRDLKERNIVHNWPTLLRWIDENGFPPGRLVGPNTRAWTEAEIENYLASCPASKNTEARPE